MSGTGQLQLQLLGQVKGFLLAAGAPVDGTGAPDERILVALARHLSRLRHDVHLAVADKGERRPFGHRFLIVRDDTAGNFIVDPYYKGLFEIARPSAAYKKILEELPAVLVCSPGDCMELLTYMDREMRSSFATCEMKMPPWRSLKVTRQNWSNFRFEDEKIGGPSPPPRTAVSASAPSEVSVSYW